MTKTDEKTDGELTKYTLNRTLTTNINQLLVFKKFSEIIDMYTQEVVELCDETIFLKSGTIRQRCGREEIEKGPAHLEKLFTN